MKELYHIPRYNYTKIRMEYYEARQCQHCNVDFLPAGSSIKG